MGHTDGQRYCRQTILPEFAPRGQEKLAQANVLIVGAGGLGSVLALYLAAAGVGKILIADHDRVELSNLNRQIVHAESSIGENKAVSAANRLTALNSTIRVIPISEKLTEKTIRPWLDNIDLLLDGTDNYPARQMINRVSLAYDIPWIFGGVQGFDGMSSIFNTGTTPCFECIFPSPRKTAAGPASGIIGPAAGATGSFQAMAAIKTLLGIPSGLENKLLRISGADMRVHFVRIAKDPLCPACRSNTIKKADS